MTEPSNPDLVALLTGDAASTPEQRAALAKALVSALAATKRTPDTVVDARLMAAHFEGALSPADKERVLNAIAHDPLTLADLESAQALLETVRAAPQPRSAARIAAARAILEQAQPERASWLVRLGLTSPRRAVPAFGALAVASVCAVLVWPVVIAPKSLVTGGASSMLSAYAPRPEPTQQAREWSGVAKDVGQSDGWAAFAVSSADQRYGAATGAATKAEADVVAMASCRQAGGGDCNISGDIQGECLSIAAASPKPPAARSDPDAATATKAALEACSGKTCRTVKTICPNP